MQKYVSCVKIDPGYIVLYILDTNIKILIIFIHSLFVYLFHVQFIQLRLCYGRIFNECLISRQVSFHREVLIKVQNDGMLAYDSVLIVTFCLGLYVANLYFLASNITQSGKLSNLFVMPQFLIIALICNT